MATNQGTASARHGAEAAPDAEPRSSSRTVTLFVCGDVMTGRGIDQILPHPGNPRLLEPYVESAHTYVELAERTSGRIPKPVAFDYVWGDALAELQRRRPDVRIVNLETAVTASEEAWPGKDIHYRMHPGNVPCLTAAAIDCCSLANNHVLDWGRSGLTETLTTLRQAGIRTVGAGETASAAAAPAVVDAAGGARVAVFAFATEGSGVPRAWQATRERSGVNLIDDLSARGADVIGAQVAEHSRNGDIVVASIHWGGNWGYEVPEHQRYFAHRLIDHAGVDIVHGHSSHHPRGIEVHRGKAIIYGCGDLLNDYEGISGYERYRANLALMYFLTLETDGRMLQRLSMTPTRTQRLCINKAPPEAASWLAHTMDRECRKLGARVELKSDGALELSWSKAETGVTS